ncbi:MAG: N-6 DNA methylase [Alphaproteobacteria bacterium]|nr:N-6 DNA methylase [Rickettsiales bacterium]
MSDKKLLKEGAATRLAFNTYIKEISEKFKSDMTSEMGYRTHFEILLKNIFPKENIGHDDRARENNKPDFVITNSAGVEMLYIEAKTIGVSLDKTEKLDQMKRYFGYANLVLTDYTEFRFYRNGTAYGKIVKIADFNIKTKTIKAKPENYTILVEDITNLAESQIEMIKSGHHLAQVMGGKAKRIRDYVSEIFAQDQDDTDDNTNTVNADNNEIKKVYDVIKNTLVNDLDVKNFTDMYAQTLVYGLFIARYHDDTLDSFTRQKARNLIPSSNPFLMHFFDHIAGVNFDKKLSYIVDELCTLFLHSDVKELMETYTKQKEDPIIYFYEDFLEKYDSVLKKKMGVYYTPTPIVNFIVRSVDEIIKKDFNLPGGLCDTTLVNKTLANKTLANKTPVSTTHKVQILDPAVGTGTFFSAIINHIYENNFRNIQEGKWNKYVEKNLLPRLHGFELMMTPYIIAHLKLNLVFKKTGFNAFKQRLGIYLTNSLEGIKGIDEESQEQLKTETGFGLMGQILEESKHANKIKNNTQIMVIVGNPPYSVSSSNKGAEIKKLLEVYKKNLNEINLNSLSDDYIKFIRYAEFFIEKNKTGIVAMVTNNSFVDGIISRQMRKHLLETFDDIYILDLHGSARKKEKSPDGSKDENVFNIMQGVSINIFVRKNENKKELGTVYHADLFGLKELKYNFLNQNNNESIKTVKWQKINYTEPYYFFVPKDFSSQDKYSKGFKVSELFCVKLAGIATGDDKNLVSFKSFKKNNQKYLYRPFDIRNINYDLKKVSRHRFFVMKHIIEKDNIGLMYSRTCVDKNKPGHGMVFNKLADMNLMGAMTYCAPIYLYPEKYSLEQKRIPNFNDKIINDFANKINLKFTNEKTDEKETFAPIDVLDYICAMLHSPSYRNKYKELLKIDFPVIPYPADVVKFKQLVEYGKELREIYLLESLKLENNYTANPIAAYPVAKEDEAADVVEIVKYKDNKVFINKEQYFGNVPELAWNFYIGIHQPAQKWLKDRKKVNYKLTYDDLIHYQKVIIALIETDRIMKEIDTHTKDC